MNQLSPYRAFCEKWAAGCGTTHCERAGRVVTARGKLPCDLLFVGEAPGQSEDVLGQPFVGPAGRLLDSIVARGLSRRPGTRVAFCNVVGCMPRNDDGSRDPADDQIEACKPRLEELIALANPRAIVTVGKISREWLEQGLRHSVKLPGGVRLYDIVHPAYILRANEANRGLLEQKCVIVIANAADDIGAPGAV